MLTSSTEAQYAADLRAARDQTDAQIAAEYPAHPTAEQVATHRGRETLSRRHWTEQALSDVLAKVLFRHRQVEGGALTDLDGVTITLTLSDLVATARLLTRDETESVLDEEVPGGA